MTTHKEPTVVDEQLRKQIKNPSNVPHPTSPVTVPDELDKTILHTKITELGIDYGYFWNNTLDQEPADDCATRNAFTSQLLALFTQYGRQERLDEAERFRANFAPFNKRMYTDPVEMLDDRIAELTTTNEEVK